MKFILKKKKNEECLFISGKSQIFVSELLKECDCLLSCFHYFVGCSEKPRNEAE